jgi:hypothetical protein
MQKMIAYCGITCDECPALLATRKDDDEKRAEVAEQWSKLYNTDVKPEEVNCSGCLSANAVLYKHCQVCEIRKCGMEKNVANCAYCDDYVCEKLGDLFIMVPKCRELLRGIKEKL